MKDTPLIYLALGFHNHQPVGNFPEVFEKHFREAYLPFMDAMAPHADVPFSLHLTGPLLQWLAEHHPDYVARLRRLCAQGRVEMKGGGYYEPILAAIPDDDKREQLERLSSYLDEQLGTTPEGAWIAERVWEPHLARHLAQAGLAYATLDDSQFFSAGLSQADTFGYYVTEEGGFRFDLFPINKELRYLIPFQEPEATITYLRDVEADWRERRRSGALPPDAPPPLAVYDDDGEKFGGWPGTHEHVYRSGWLERFLRALKHEQKAGWLALTTPGAYRRLYHPLGRIYIPTASYAEMLEWSHGFYRNFLVRYDEANLLHKRMLHTSLGVTRRLHALEREPLEPGADPKAAQEHRRSERRALQNARDRVLRSQCNDAYWHGVFGGIYLPHLRHAAYAGLIEAEAAAGPALRPPLETVDLDLDGYDEHFLRSAGLTVLVRPAEGGAVVSLDHLGTSFALLDTLRRRREPEHEVLERLAAAGAGAGGNVDTQRAGGRDESTGPDAAHEAAQSIHDLVRMKEPGLERMLFVDHHPRSAFIDHFFGPDIRVADLVTGSALELGDLAGGTFELVAADPASPSVTLERTGSVAGSEVTVRKTISLGQDPEKAAVSVAYEIDVGETAPADAAAASDALPAPSEVLFAPEVNLTLLAGWAHDRYVLVDDSRPSASFLADEGTHPGASRVALVDESRRLVVTLSWDGGPSAGSSTTTLLRYGVVTVSLSEEGFERIYQSTALLPCHPLALAPGTSLRTTLRLDVVGP